MSDVGTATVCQRGLSARGGDSHDLFDLLTRNVEIGRGMDGDVVDASRGEPSDVQTRSILRRPSYFLNGRYYYYGDAMVEVPVEIWTYNFGPYKLMRRVRFVDGLVEEIETLGYGYRANE